jgi:hypothetical protein
MTPFNKCPQGIEEGGEYTKCIIIKKHDLSGGDNKKKKKRWILKSNTLH